jgi:hypothetical protein
MAKQFVIAGETTLLSACFVLRPWTGLWCGFSQAGEWMNLNIATENG